MVVGHGVGTRAANLPWRQSTAREKEVEGACAASLILWGLQLCTEADTISLPADKLLRAQEFLTDKHFGPGVTRIPLGLIQVLRGAAEHWSQRNTSLGPELHVIDKMLRSHCGLSKPRWELTKLKQVYFDFWGTMEIFRVNMSNPKWRSTAYSSSFASVLTLSERLSFTEIRNRAIWTGTDETPERRAAANRTNKSSTVFDADKYYDFLADLTGLPRGDYVLIAIAEFMSLVCLLIASAKAVQNANVCYAGGQKNVITWIRRKRPGNRVAKFPARILSRIENEYGFDVSPMYISTSNNRMQDELSRLGLGGSIELGVTRGYTFVDVSYVAHRYFHNRMAEFALVLPTEDAEAAKRIRKFVEKRLVRHIPLRIMTQCAIVVFGVGLNGGSAVRQHPRLAGVTWRAIPWPSETQLLEAQDTPIADTEYIQRACACLFTMPHNEADSRFLNEKLSAVSPKVVVFGCHPLRAKNILRHSEYPWIFRDRSTWAWQINSALLGEPQSRDRCIYVGIIKSARCGGRLLLYLSSMSYYRAPSVNTCVATQPVHSSKGK